MPTSTLVQERAIKPFVIGRKNFLFSDTPARAEASAAIYSVVVTAKLNGLNQRAYLEWLLFEMPNDAHLGEPGRIDRYLPWSDEVPDSCRLTKGRVDEAEALPDEPIVDGEVLEAVEGTLETANDSPVARSNIIRHSSTEFCLSPFPQRLQTLGWTAKGTLLLPNRTYVL